MWDGSELSGNLGQAWLQDWKRFAITESDNKNQAMEESSSPSKVSSSSSDTSETGGRRFYVTPLIEEAGIGLGCTWCLEEPSWMILKW